MKKLVAIILLVSMVVTTSCTSVYKTSSMNEKYDNKMALHRATQAEIEIYLAEKEIPHDFEVVSLNRYYPLAFWSVVLPPFSFIFQKKKMVKTFYKKAVLRAKSQRGDAVLLTAPGHYKVIRYVVAATPSEITTAAPAPVVE